MLIAILGDVHGNLEALEAVLGAADRANVDRMYQLGDVVGYGADPGPCIDLLRERDVPVCLGNHDAAVCRRIEPHDFNPFARLAVEWTRTELGSEQLDWLSQLPWTVESEELDAVWVHASLAEPEGFDYVRSLPAAARCLQEQRARWSFVGHTHIPLLFHTDPELDCVLEPCFESDGFVSFRELPEKVLVNCGSVGQPRDEDARAALVLWDSERSFLRLERVNYDISAAQQKILSRGLPPILAERLAFGL